MVSRKTLVWIILCTALSVSELRADSLTNSGGWLSWGAANNESSSAGPISSPVTAAPVMIAAPVAQPAPAEAQQAQVATTAPPAGGVYNAFVNLGIGPYTDASTITTGNAQPWYDSTPVENLFGGPLTTAQQSTFASAVMQDVKQTFQLSGVNVSLTNDPTQPAAHMLSLVSNTSAQILPSAIGMTFVGGSGFSFIDQQANSVTSINQLEWIAAHNISHELMLAFGVGENYDQTGNYIDARNANFSMITSPNATFSTAAAAALNQALSQDPANTTAQQLAQVIEPKPVPEPATLVIWGLTATAAVLLRKRSQRRAQA